MLESLRIRNLALVEDLDITFGPGFNAITGETGAGKSLLIGALNLLLGERAEKNAVRSGACEAVVEACLVVSDVGEIDAMLQTAGLDACEEGRLLLRRIIPRTGAGRNIVNGGATTLAVFKRLGERLVDLHGPHEHQSLFREGPRIAMLDAYGGAASDRQAYETVYRELNALNERRTALAGTDDAVAAQMDMLEFQVRELEEAKLDPDEEASLAAELDRVANAQRIRELRGALGEALMGDEVSAFRSLTEAQRLLTELERLYPEAAESHAEIRALAGQLKAVSENLVAGLEDIDDDPERLHYLENRMALYFRLKRKYNCRVPELLERLEAWRLQCDQWRSRDETLRVLDGRIADCRRQLRDRAATLGKRRRKAAKKMAAAITRQLADLGLAQGEFRVSVEPAAPRASGADRVDYAFTPNLGEPTAPLQMIASSGEISRVMLAVKAVLAEHDRVPILVFDEIDANLGGEAGHAVGRKLRTLARHRQVIGITHLPQVAACAQTHLAVAKETAGGRTRTTVKTLDGGKARAAELARMLGGRDAGTAALHHAEAMLTQAGG